MLVIIAAETNIVVSHMTLHVLWLFFCFVFWFIILWYLIVPDRPFISFAVFWMRITVEKKTTHHFKPHCVGFMFISLMAYQHLTQRNDLGFLDFTEWTECRRFSLSLNFSLSLSFSLPGTSLFQLPKIKLGPTHTLKQTHCLSVLSPILHRRRDFPCHMACVSQLAFVVIDPCYS